MTKKKLAPCALGWMLVMLSMGCSGLSLGSSATPTSIPPTPEPTPVEIPISVNLDNPVTLESEQIRYTVLEVIIAGNSVGETGVIIRIPPDQPNHYLLMLHVSAENLTGEPVLAGQMQPASSLFMADASGNDLDCVAVCGMHSTDRGTCQNLLGFLVEPARTNDAYLVFLVPNDVNQFLLSVR
ncbi:MAG TPA: hypothetical protein G4O08_06110 [Anaerolineae bacterium]|nr:hypothetical protein [Anaerolineae bacterium]